MTIIIWQSFLAFFAGLLLNFTPCVLPVIPLKIQTILRETDRELGSRALAAICMLSGTLVFFLTIGIATAYFGFIWGSLFQSKMFVVGMSIFLFIAAVATLLDCKFNLPQTVYKAHFSRLLGAFVTGLLAGILSTPCSGPFLAGVLSYTLVQSPVVIISIFMAIGAGLASPYVLILLKPSLLDRLTVFKPWAGQVKYIFGFILLAGSLFFGQVLIPDPYLIIVWSLLLMVIAVWALVNLIRSRSWPARFFPIALLLSLLFVGLNLLKSPADRPAWQSFSAQILETSLAAHRPVLLEFTADWCLNCKILERVSYSDESVTQAGMGVDLVFIQVDMTHLNQINKALLLNYGGTSLPYAVLIDRNGGVATTFSGMFAADTLEQAILGLQR